LVEVNCLRPLMPFEGLAVVPHLLGLGIGRLVHALLRWENVLAWTRQQQGRPRLNGGKSRDAPVSTGQEQGCPRLDGAKGRDVPVWTAG